MKEQQIYSSFKYCEFIKFTANLSNSDLYFELYNEFIKLDKFTYIDVNLYLYE